MNSNSDVSTVLSGPSTSAASWDLRHPGLIMTGSNGEEIHEFTGMWPLKPDADLVGLTYGLSREAPYWGGPGRTFSEATTALGLIRSAYPKVSCLWRNSPRPSFPIASPPGLQTLPSVCNARPILSAFRQWSRWAPSLAASLRSVHSEKLIGTKCRICGAALSGALGR